MKNKEASQGEYKKCKVKGEHAQVKRERERKKNFIFKNTPLTVLRNLKGERKKKNKLNDVVVCSCLEGDETRKSEFHDETKKLPFGIREREVGEGSGEEGGGGRRKKGETKEEVKKKKKKKKPLR